MKPTLISLHRALFRWVAVLVAAGCATASVRAQTGDPVLDLLVRKGLVTREEADAARREADTTRRELETARREIAEARREATEARAEAARAREAAAALRTETDRAAKKAFAAGLGQPEWVSGYRIGGDLRMRYEGFYADNPAATDRDRFQYRLRLAFAAQMLDRMQVFLRVASVGDTAGNPISSNQTLDNNASKKGLAIDQIYARWAAVKSPAWTADLTFGKMESPFLFTAAIIDPDYTPEGFAQQFAYRVDARHELKFNLGQFVLEERPASPVDAYMGGAQALWESKWSARWQTALGLGVLGISGKDNLTIANGQLNIGEGNTRTGNLAANPPRYNFHPVIADAAVTYLHPRFPGYPGAFPVRLAGEYFRNSGAPKENDGLSAKLTFGRTARRGTWEGSYEFRLVRADAIYEELAESDFNAFTQAARTVGGTSGFVNGTNVRGHVVKLGYAPLDSLSLSATGWFTRNLVPSPAGSRSAAQRLQLDALWRF